MKYYIYVYRRQGNIGPFEFLLINEQPTDGFVTELQAEVFLLDLIDKRKGNYFERDWYKFIIHKTYSSKSVIK